MEVSRPLCIGETVVYTCTVQGLGHTWNISSLPSLTSVMRSTPMRLISPFNLTLIEDSKSTLSLTVFDGFNGTVITCGDANTQLGEGNEQTTIAIVFGESL